MSKVLTGIRVADFSRVMAGPYGSHFLSLLGATVIKVEDHAGDPMRYYGADRRYDGMSPAFIAANAGKKSIALDLKQEAGREVARRLVGSCDVVLENFRPGVMERLGLGYEACKALRPDLVYCSISGYGQAGPLRDYPAIDNVVQATSGMMMLSGEPGAPPARVGFPLVDTYAGTIAAFSIVTALLGRERFGGGQLIDVSMLDSSLVLMAAAVVPLLVTGAPLQRTGNKGYSGLFTAGMFTAKDGAQISLGVVQQNQYEALCRGIGRPELIADPRFATTALRKEHSAPLCEILDRVFAERDGSHWERVLSEAGAPCGLVRDLSQVLAHPQLDGRQIRQPIAIPDLPDRQNVHVLNTGFQFATLAPGVEEAPPRLGEHTDAILTELGFDAAARAQLREQRVVYPQ